MLEANRMEKIEVLTMAEVVDVTGYIGNFDIKIKQYPRYIDAEKCNGCGLCAQVCPVVIPNPFDEGLSPRKVADIAFAQAVPNTYDIAIDSCIRCYECSAACDQDAIVFSQQETIKEVRVGSIVLATGWDLYKPTLEKGYDYGYGRFENVIDQLALERILAPNGPTLGHVKRPSDGKTPKRIVMIQCVGSRGDVNEHCSAVCCGIASKNAKLLKSEYPDAEIIISYIDMRMSGKDYEEYYKRSREAGIIFVNGKVGEVREVPETKNLIVTMEDKGTGEVLEVEADMVVITPASLASEGTEQIARVMKLERNAAGFLKEFHSRLNPVDSKVDGVFLAGSCQGQKAINDAVSQAKGAASAAAILVDKGEHEIEMIRAVVENQEACSRCYRCVDACPFSALSINDDGRLIVDIVACKGCGTCSNVCRSHTIQLRYFRDMQYEAYLDALFPEPSTD